MTDYRQIIADTPELALHLAHAITPSVRPADGGSRSSTRQDAASSHALDDLDQLATELVESVRFWQQAFDEYGLAVPTLDVRVPTVSDNPEAAAKAIQPLVSWLLTNWDDAEGHPFHEWWCESLDEWLAPKVKRLQREGKRQHPRRCQLCGTLSVWADLDHATGLCDQCGHVHRAEMWVSVREAALVLGVNRSTITRWVQAGAITAKKGRLMTMVEIGECREQQQLAVGRQRLGLRQRYASGVVADKNRDKIGQS